MSHDKKLRSQKAGLEPGSLVHLGEVKTSTPTLMLLEYDSTGLYEQELSSREQIDGLVRRPGCTLWLNVYGLQDPDLMAAIGKRFGLHPLVLEDILNTDQRPKVDDYEDYLYLVARLFDYVPHSRQLASDQVSIILGKDFVLTFQERPSGTFGALRERLRANRNQVRRLGADYLAYSLLDSLVDRYFALVEQVGDHAEILETSLINRRPRPGVLQSIHRHKRQITTLRRAIWPLREVLNVLLRSHDGFFRAETVLYLRDVYDHTVHLIESLEDLRDLLTGLLDVYLSAVSNRVNMEVRALTVVATIFMPATLIAGVFGMNFHVMPWLEHPDGFWFAMGLMGAIATIMLAAFWRRRLIG